MSIHKINVTFYESNNIEAEEETVSVTVDVADDGSDYEYMIAGADALMSSFSDVVVTGFEKTGAAV